METLNKLPQWQRITLLLVIPAILSFYLLFFFIIPAREEKDKLLTERDNLVNEIENAKRSLNPKILENLRKKEEETKKLLEDKQRELEAITGVLPTQKDLSMVVRTVGNLASKNGLVMTNMQIGQPQEVIYTLEDVGGKKLVKELQPQAQQQQQQQEGVKYMKAELRINLLGSYSAFRKFLEEMQKGGIISYPTSLQLSQEGGNKLRGELTIYIVMKEEGQ